MALSCSSSFAIRLLSFSARSCSAAPRNYNFAGTPINLICTGGVNPPGIKVLASRSPKRLDRGTRREVAADSGQYAELFLQLRNQALELLRALLLRRPAKL